jgi:signal transduction histidine kinase
MRLLSNLSIKARIIATTTVVLGLIFVCFSLIVYQKAKSAYYGRLDARLQGYAERIRGEVEEQYYEKRFPNAKDFHELGADGLAGSLVRLSDKKGKEIFGDSVLAGPGFRTRDAIKPGQFTFANIERANVRYRSLWAGVEVEDRDQYAVQIVVPLAEVESALQLLQLLFLLGVPIALALSAVAIYAIVKTAFRPLSAMIRAAENVTGSNLGERIPSPDSHDEVFALASTLNTMMERIEKAFKSQKQFIADASHEIRTPLAIIRSELEYAQKQIGEAASKESLDAALDEIDRLKKLSDDLLLLAKLDSIAVARSFQPVRLDELLADCVKKMKPIADAKNVTLSLTVEEAVEIKADEDKLRSAFLNLIDNAIKYSQDAGNVDIVTRSTENGVEVSVRDQGEGIEEAELKNIFERFHRAASSRSRHDGNGLGLAIVQLIVGLHNGELTVESRPGKGSTFRIFLPNGKGN